MYGKSRESVTLCNLAKSIRPSAHGIAAAVIEGLAALYRSALSNMSATAFSSARGVFF